MINVALQENESGRYVRWMSAGKRVPLRTLRVV